MRRCDHSDLSEEQILALSDAFAQGSSGNLKVKLGDTSYYLVYEGTAVQNWSMVGLVPVSIVNASLDQLWFYTVQIVAGIVLGFAVLVILLIARRSHVTLRQKDTEIRYRDVLFQKLSLNVDDVFLMLDAETSTADYVSPNIGRLLGIPWRNVRQDVHALVALYPKDDPDRDKNFLEGLSRGEQREWDAAYLHQETREPRWFHIVAMGSEVEGKTKYILVMSDRTADKQVNQALSDAVAAAETANRAKSTFLSNMSHDIRTPMNAIIGFTTLAISNLDDKERVKDYLTKTLASSNHLLSLINDVLDMSRIESGKVTLEAKPVHLPELVHELRDIVQAVVSEKDLSLTLDTVGVENEDVIADPLRLEQILINVLANAVKFTPDGGQISLWIVQKDTAPAGCADFEFHIKDNGIGMSEEFQKHIFEQFARERTSTVSKIQGTGLGMAITKSLVDMMGGRITVKSEQGKGSEFTISLRFPIGEAKTEQTPPAAKASASAGKKLLVVEDNELNLEIASTLLKEAGFAVDTAENGKIAVEKVEAASAGRYDLILMDVQMPEMDGYEATRRIRALPDKKKAAIPIVAMTANAFEEDQKNALNAGMNGHIAKPLDIQKLFQVLSELLK